MTDYEFTMKESGGCGTIVYHEQDQRIGEKIYWEISTDPDEEIVIWPMDLREWDEPRGKEIDTEHQLKILQCLRQWLKTQNIRSNIDLPLEVTTTDQECVWADCSGRRIKGSPYCPRHYDLNLLVVD